MRFNGTVLVPIDGVDFRPYVEILLRPSDGIRIADRVVVITDADPSLSGNRKDDLEAFAGELDAADRLHVFTNQVTFEHELFTAANKESLNPSSCDCIHVLNRDGTMKSKLKPPQTSHRLFSRCSPLQ